MAAIGNLPVAYVDVKEGDTLYIGVGGAGTNATFTVRAHVRVAGREPLLSMLEAIPQGDAIGINGPAWNYYQINMPAVSARYQSLFCKQQPPLILRRVLILYV
jgi:hypothetical protein